jgi:hypothetical protein
LQAEGFRREEHSDALYKYLRLGGRMSRVRVERRENYELAEVYCLFRHFEDGVWPSGWQSIGIPAPRCEAIVGAFDLESWNDKDNWYGSFYARMRFLDADLADYADLLRQNGFTDPEYSGDIWELEKLIRVGGARYRVRISDTDNNEIPEVAYSFREEASP